MYRNVESDREPEKMRMRTADGVRGLATLAIFG